MYKRVFLTALALFSIFGCREKPKFSEEELTVIPLSQREDLPRVSGGFVMVVGGETVTFEDVISQEVLEYFEPSAQKTFMQFRKKVRPDIERLVTTKISNILLYKQALREAGSESGLEQALKKAVETELRRFIAGFEGDSVKAEQALKKMGMDWDDYGEYMRKMILSEDYIRKQMPDDRPVTYSELLIGYDEMKEEYFSTPALITFRLIDLQIPNLKVTDPNSSPKEQARKLANELMERLQKGEDFGDLAKQYSNGHRAPLGGLWKPVQPDSLAEPYDVLAAKAEKMLPSQISGPIEIGEHIFIIKLEEKQTKNFAPFDEVQKEVEAKILFDRRKKAVDELSDKLVQQAALNEMDAFVDFCVERVYRIYNQ